MGSVRGGVLIWIMIGVAYVIVAVASGWIFETRRLSQRQLTQQTQPTNLFTETNIVGPPTMPTTRR